MFPCLPSCTFACFERLKHCMIMCNCAYFIGQRAFEFALKDVICSNHIWFDLLCQRRAIILLRFNFKFPKKTAPCLFINCNHSRQAHLSLRYSNLINCKLSAISEATALSVPLKDNLLNLSTFNWRRWSYSKYIAPLLHALFQRHW